LSATIVIFGYNELSKEIVSTMREQGEAICIYCFSDDEFQSATSEELEIYRVEVDSNFDFLRELDIKRCRFLCTIDDEAKNLFLSLSLRDLLGDNAHIIALATTAENALKLRLAGASIVVAQIQSAANTIVHLLEYPALSCFFEKILDSSDSLQVAQVSISGESKLLGSDLCRLELDGVIVLGVIRHERSEQLFVVEIDSYLLCENDTLILIANQSDLEQIR